MQEIIDWLWQYITKDIWEPGRGDFWGALMAAILFGVFYAFRKTLRRAIGLIQGLSRKRIVIPKALHRYKKVLDKETLRLNHSWKLEGQSLKELIVPISVFETDEINRKDLVEFYCDYSKEKKTPRLLILGEAGSGKSVSMGILARAVWNIDSKKILLPVLVTFSEIKSVRTANEFIKVIVQSLEKYQFELGKKKKQASIFVEENLYEGNIIILIDGLDELDKSTRFECARFLNYFFQTYSQIPFVFSSRISVWRQNPTLFNVLDIKVIYVAAFTPFEIRQYLSQWQFTGEKSADRLAMLISEKSYLRSFAANPLILTIISFLYAQPKRVLPDNRVSFYYECIEALMEKFDNTRAIDRANQFEKVDKISILSRLAYQHITDSNQTDEDILKSKILEIIEEEMRALSRPVEKREKLLNEIVYNSELLVDLPPDAYKFPHRTFMEYFAANYFIETSKHIELLNLYAKDKGKWQETLALFCGMNLNGEISDTILKYLLQEFNSTSESQNPDVFIFKALTESARINPIIAEEILNKAKNYLRINIHTEIVEYLGYISLNPTWSHNQESKKILLSLLSSDLPKKSFEKILLSVVHLPDPQIKEMIMRHMGKINLRKLLITASIVSEEYTLRILENISTQQLDELFSGLRETGNLKLLFNQMIKSNRADIKQRAAWALALTSDSEIFWNFLESMNLDEILHPHAPNIDNLFKRYSWPNKRFPLKAAGQKAVFSICILVADYAIAQNFQTHKFQQIRYIHNLVKYLASAILHEQGYPFRRYSLLLEAPRATKSGIVTHWKKLAKYSSNDLQFTIAFVPYLLVNVTGLIVHKSNNIPLMITGLGCCAGIVLIIPVIILSKDGEDFLNSTWLTKIHRGILRVCFPLATLAYAGDLRKRFSSKISTILLISFASFVVLALIPMPLFFKLTNMVLVFILAAIEIFSSFLSPLGNIFPNDEVHELLSKKDSEP